MLTTLIEMTVVTEVRPTHNSDGSSLDENSDYDIELNVNYYKHRRHSIVNQVKKIACSAADLV